MSDFTIVRDINKNLLKILIETKCINKSEEVIKKSMEKLLGVKLDGKI
jgi:hypothetical protein